MWTPIKLWSSTGNTTQTEYPDERFAEHIQRLVWRIAALILTNLSWLSPKRRTYMTC
jgi:hypothetical protein